MTKIYLDDAATTQVWPEVAKEISKRMLEDYGNPSSLHNIGEKALDRINKAREKLAQEINAKPWEIYFTSGGTEADNLAIFGIAKANPQKKKIIISSIEHAAIIEPCEELRKEGYEIIKIPVSKEGLIDLEKLDEEIDEKTLLVSIMHANNIIGTIQPIKEIGRICKKNKVIFHTDAAQTYGKLKIDVEKMNIDLLTASAHKIGGPKGIGLLYIKERTKIKPIIIGGGQEKGIRSGTENTPGIIGFAKALEIQKKIPKENIRKLRDQLMQKLESIGGEINGSKENRNYNNIHVSFPKTESDTLVIYLSQKDIYVSSGSACDSKKDKEDHVLKAIRQSSKKGSIRITINKETTEKDINKVVKTLKEVVKTLSV